MQPTTAIVYHRPETVISQLPLSKTRKIIRGVNFALIPVLFIGILICVFIFVSMYTFVPLVICFCLFFLNVIFCCGHSFYLGIRNARHYTQSQQNAATGNGVTTFTGVPVVQPDANVLHPPPPGLMYCAPTTVSVIPTNESYHAAAWAYNPAVYPPRLADQSVAPPVSPGVVTIYPPPPVENPDTPPSYDQLMSTKSATLDTQVDSKQGIGTLQ